MFKKILNQILHPDQSVKVIKSYQPLIDKINALDSQYSSKTDTELKQLTHTFKERLKGKETLDDLLPEAFALVREAAKRTLNMRHFDVQLMGGIALHQGRIAEMKTGEGKTLVSTLPAYLNALEGKGVYIVTVNDYLAKRDSEWMGQIHRFLGLKVGLIQANDSPEDKRAAYEADITYGTNNEFGFDYLRDHLCGQAAEVCQYRKHYAIIDEIDSILVDEARTPLIISGPVPDKTKIYKKLLPLCKKLLDEEHFTIEEKNKNIILTESGINQLEKNLRIDNLYSTDHMAYAHIAVQTLRAIHLYSKDVDYVVKDKKVEIVDEFTGRILEGRRYSDGLHQAIEAKESVHIQQESQTLASITYQNYFRLFPKLSGMTGTAKTEEEEFLNIYNLDVIVVPTHKVISRKDLDDVIYKSKTGKFNAIVEEVKLRHQKGQPILIGTVAIESSEELSKLLSKAKIPHNVLNAKQHEKEAEIIKSAGNKHAVTIATNMAGRGTDIVLGEGVLECGGLCVLGSERHESRRIDNQLRGRSGRQGDPGESKFFVALDDPLMRLFGSDKISGVMEKLGMNDETPIEHKWLNSTIERAQKKVEMHHFSIRKQILEFDDVLDSQRNTIYAIREDIVLNQASEKRLNEGLYKIADQIIPAHLKSFKQLEKNLDTNKTIHDVLLELDPSEQLLTSFKRLKDSSSPKDALIKSIKTQIEEKKSQIPEHIFTSLLTMIMLKLLDRKWMDHLYNMDNLREGIGLRAYGQRNPLVEYKIEGFKEFQDLLFSFYKETYQFICRVEVVEKVTDPLLTQQGS